MSEGRCSQCGQVVPDAADVPHACGFSPQQRAIYARILGGECATVSDIVATLWPRPEDEPPAADLVVRNQLYRMRQRMVPTPWLIATARSPHPHYRITHRGPP